MSNGLKIEFNTPNGLKKDFEIPVVLAFAGGIIIWSLLNAIEKEKI